MTNSIAGISGGRTSAMMAYGLPPETILCFQNTGREHEKTLEFLCRLEDDLGRPIIRIEWRSPPRGDAPRFSSFEIVSHKTMARKGEPIIEALETIAAFRKKHKGKGPLAPWARRRLCTAYVKLKTKARYIQSLGWDTWTNYVGLRYDEPQRISALRRASPLYIDERFPLNEQRVTKADVLAFWAKKPFDLGLPEYLGNCIECFLKDESHLATALLDPQADPGFALGIENKFGPMRRGSSPSYQQVLAEAPARLKIRDQLARGETPTAHGLPDHRFKLIVRQERRLDIASMSCGCEGASALAEAEDDELLLDDAQLELAI